MTTIPQDAFFVSTAWLADHLGAPDVAVIDATFFLPDEKRGEPRIVWGRKQTQTDECPKSLVRGESLAMVEEFFVRRRLGVGGSIGIEASGLETSGLETTAARKVDAFLILRDDMEREERDGKTHY